MYLVPLTSLLVLLFCQILPPCFALELKNAFITSTFYTNVRIFTSKANVFSTLYIPKGSLPSVTMTCATLCGQYESCFAFNIFEAESSHGCELLPENLCHNSSTLSLTEWPGSSIWDKVTPGSTRTCLETRFPFVSSIPCSSLKPGCIGTWPSCSNCVRNCIECKQRYGYTGDSACTFWPDGDIPSAKPIFGLCYEDATYLIKRNVDRLTGTVTIDYRLPLEDMSRIARQGDYSLLEFYFHDRVFPQRFRYKNPYFDCQGTLSNLTFNSAGSNYDILQLKGQVLEPTPFVTVQDDLLGCGSFWLFDSTNNTKCPGGRISMLGTPKFVGPIVMTGIRVDIMYYAYCSLAFFP